MSIASEITRIQNAKTALKSSIEAKGVSVPAEAKIDAYSTLVDSISSGGGQEISGQEEITIEFGDELTVGDAVCINGIYRHEESNLMSGPTTIQAVSQKAAISSSGRYLAAVMDNSPRLILYKRKGEAFIAMASPEVMPTSYTRGAAFSYDDTYLAISGLTSGKQIMIYKRNKDTFTYVSCITLSNPNVAKMMFSKTSNDYLFAVHNVAPSILIFKRNGDEFIKLNEPTELPSDISYDLSLSPDDKYLAVGQASSSDVFVYEKNGDVFTKLVSPYSVPNNSRNVCFSPDGNYFAVASDTDPRLMLYTFNNGIFISMPPLETLPTKLASGIIFSSDGMYLFYLSNPIYKYKLIDGVFTPCSTTMVTQSISAASFCSDGTYLALSYSKSPYLQVFKGSEFVKNVAYKSENGIYEIADAVCIGYAKENGLAGEEKKVIKIWG